MPLLEIEMMQKAGMTPLQVIVSATKHAARVCGLEDEIGTLEVGKRADVLVVDGNPLQDMRALAEAKLVMRDGVII
jgi:imidazolonepropionase-like amidohydrolase